jgi:uncharacterized protein (UPF0332 family)
VISLLEELFEKGLLKKTGKSNAFALKSLEQAGYFLGEAEDLLKLDKERMTVIALYSALFHASRALLFKDGVKEKSHYAVARYIEFEYVDKGLLEKRFLLVLDTLRDSRHESQYSLVDVEIEINWVEYFDTCRQFIKAVDDLLK